MLSEKSIQQVRDLSITQVISHYLKLDRNGKACCPFHNENTPSFKVTEAKGIFKCFGCGEAGDHIAFVMKHDKLGFIEAITRIAEACGIPLEYEEVPDKEQYEKKKALRDLMQDVLQFVVADYRKNLWELPEDHPIPITLAKRGITKEIVAEWQLGWSTTEWQHLSSTIVNKGWYDPAHQLGIIKRSTDDRNYDGYRSRITIPITNRNGQYIGLAGRFQEIDPVDTGKNYPKYINPPQNELYDKSAVLYGLNRAGKAIEHSSFAYLVEGYFDVISMHAHEHENTVGTCGTALTSQQAKLLKKYTSHVVIMRDGDPAGQKASIKDLQILLKAGFKCEIIQLPADQDPDSYVQVDPKLNELKKEDAIVWFITNHVMCEGINDDQFKLGKAKESVLQLLLLIPNDIIRGNYFDAIIKKYKWPKGEMQKRLNALLDEKEEVQDDGATELDKMPGWMNKEEFMAKGYCSIKNPKRVGYYGFNAGGKVEITNFLITPIFHIYGEQSKHLIEIDNGKRKATLEIESKCLVSIELLQNAVVREGAYLVYGTKPQWLRIATDLLSSFALCYPVEWLGWQQSGFFGFINKIFTPSQGLQDLSEWGVHVHDNENYLISAASPAYTHVLKSGNDEFENFRVLSWRPGKITFSEWAAQMLRVYKEKGPVAVAYVVLTLFRDIVFDIDNNCPHLYGYGERSSGKSKWAESISAVFYKKRSAFNLNSSTDHAFFTYMRMFINCPSFLNEFDIEVVRPEWFQAIKGAYDGESRQRGVMGSKNKIEIMKIRSTLMLIGQYLVTADDNSVVSRSLIEPFTERELTEDDKREYDKLKAYEENGLSNLIVEILKHRAYVKEHYRDQFNEILNRWRRGYTGDQANFNQRIMQNWCHLLTCWKLISDHIPLPLSVDQFEVYCKNSAEKWSRFIRQTDTLNEFWQTLGFLADQGMIEEGWDYKIEFVNTVRIRKSRDEEVSHDFPGVTKVLFVRLNNVHKLYQESFKKRSSSKGKEALSLENLRHYFTGRKYFIGASKQKVFKRFVTTTENVTVPGGYPGSQPVQRAETRKTPQEVYASSYVFLYDQLGLELERRTPGEAPDDNKPVNGHMVETEESHEPVDELPF